MEVTKYRVYADDTVVHEDDFEEYDNSRFGDDCKTYEILNLIIDDIVENANNLI